MPRIFIVMPAYNAGENLRRTYADIPPDLRHDLLLVDDCSRDDTVAIAGELGIPVIRHERNLGYGGNQKTCYRTALSCSAEFVAMLHPDFQYDPKALPRLLEPLLAGDADFAFGSRMAETGSASRGGMPAHKLYINRLFCELQNRQLGVRFSEHFSGFRAFTAELLRTVPFERFSNDFLFDPQMVYSSLSHGSRFAEIPIPTRYEETSSTMGLRKGAKFLLEMVRHMATYALHRRGWVSSPLYAPRAGWRQPGVETKTPPAAS